MQYRQLGQTGIQISALGFGAMRLPEIQRDGQPQLDEAAGVALIQRAFELGVNYIDTAPYYCHNQSESVVGQALKGWRHKVHVSTKTPEEVSGAKSRQMLEQSLKRMDLDYIDVYHLWGVNWDSYLKDLSKPDGPLADVLKAKEEGLIKHIAFSFHDKAENLPKLIDTGIFESLLCQYNLLDRANETAMAQAVAQGMGVIVMGPLGGGRLGYPSPVLQKMLPGKSQSSPELALRFVLANPSVTCALSGMSSIAMVEENVRIADNRQALSPAEMDQLNLAVAEKKKLEGLYCTGCNYCMPCPQEVNIPGVFEIMNNHRVYHLTDYARTEYANIGQPSGTSGKNASACSECGICEDKCPQKIAIRQQLKDCETQLASAI